MLVTKSIAWRRLLRGVFMPDLFNGSGFRFDRGVPPENHVGTVNPEYCLVKNWLSGRLDSKY